MHISVALLLLIGFQAAQEPAFKLVSTKPFTILHGSKRLGIDEPGDTRKHRMSGGSVLTLSTDRQSVIVIHPSGAISAIRPSDSFSYWVSQVQRAEEWFGSEQGRRLARESPRGYLTCFVMRGTHAVAILNWVNPMMSGSPVWFQHLVRIDARGDATLVRPLEALGGSHYESLPLRRLWSYKGRLMLHDKGRIEEIDDNGMQLRVLGDLSREYQGIGTFDGRLMLFAYQGYRYDNSKIFDSATGKIYDLHSTAFKKTS